ncbi:uncharacterized protein JCM15063_004341 [Sporobolomyces koalae]|uniref:uncharacterized protein n=1 Tax=Sporobolomyces koalae TaxID=500713 RepID=UPI00317D3C47
MWSQDITQGIVVPKSRLLVSDLDNTLFAPSGWAILARPYLKTFIRYITHPETSYSLAIWTFSGRKWGQAHLRQAGVGKLLFEGEDVVVEPPKLKDPLKVLWGYEDSGFLPSPPNSYGSMASGRAVKDLTLIWEMLNIQGHADWTSRNSLIVDDQITNGAAQPDSIVVCPVFKDTSPDDDFLLAFIGVLDELAPEPNFAAAIRRRRFRDGIKLEDYDRYSQRGKHVCAQLGIKVSRGTPYHDPAFVEDVKRDVHYLPGAVHEPDPGPVEPHPAAFERAIPVPNRVAKGMPLSPSSDYLANLAKPSKEVGKVRRPLIVFDLDGTLYHRPPQNLEHDPSGEPAGRPYLRTFLEWILRPASPWTVAIWTGSQAATAVRCLWELDLGIVGPDLINGKAEILHPKIKAVWAREDFNLTAGDYRSYVAVVKDLSRMWKHLHDIGVGDFGPDNTVMIDDTPSKLRAQPQSLIAAPTFDYPEAPSDSTSRLLLDTFLIALVAMLSEIVIESNFANYLMSQGWNHAISDKLIRSFRHEGKQCLKAAGIKIYAEGRGILPGTLESRNDPGYRTRSSTTKPISAFDRPPTSLTSDALSKVPNGANPYHSDTNTGSDTNSSVDGDPLDRTLDNVERSLGHGGSSRHARQQRIRYSRY